MEESILDTIKDSLGIAKEDNGFDQEILMHINAVLSTLFQIGVDFNNGRYIIDKDDTWPDIFTGNEELIDLAKLYIYLKVKVMFDPPSSSFVLDAMNKQSAELEWRIHVESEGGFDKDDEQ